MNVSRIIEYVKRREIPPQVKELWHRMTPQQLAIALAPLSFMIMLLGTCVAFSTSDDLPAPRKPPPQAEFKKELPAHQTFGYYANLVEGDADHLGINVRPSKLIEGLPYRVEFDGRQPLTVGKVFQTRSLRFQASLEKLWIGEPGQGIRSQHLTLRITNKLKSPVAYHVETETAGSCRVKAVMTHNELALMPNETATRTECQRSETQSLAIIRVEVLEITQLGYEYISRLDPSQIGLNPRTAGGHQTGKMGPCRLLPWRDIRRALTRKEAEWRDVMDFYARHNCDHYNYFSGYTWSRNGLKKLPAVPEEG